MIEEDKQTVRECVEEMWKCIDVEDKEGALECVDTIREIVLDAPIVLIDLFKEFEKERVAPLN